MYQYFTQLVEKTATERPGEIAYQYKEMSVTWKRYYEDINRMSNSFIALGLKPGDKIATILPQTPAFMTVFLAAAQIGLVVVPLDPRFKAAEMSKLCRRTNPRLLVCLASSEQVKETVEVLLKEIDIPYVFSYMGSFDQPSVKDYGQLLQSPVELNMPFPFPTPDDPLIIIFTSGSTGLPKGGVLTHRNTFAIAKPTVEAWGITKEDKILLNLPTSHVGGTHDQIAVQLYAGASGVLSPAFNPEEVLQMIEQCKITVLLGVPSMYRLIFQNCTVKDYNVESLKLVIVSGEPSPPELINRLKISFPNATVVTSWGMTETSGFFTFTTLKDDVTRISETEGKPGPDFEMKIIKTDGSEADANEVGELVVKGESVIKSYLDEKDNAGTFLEGWLKTGDLGYLGEDQYLHYIGRSKEMYISGGYNVYPLEIETYLNAHPEVNASCVIETTDSIWGEVGIAFIIPEKGVELNESAIMDYCKLGLADYKRPKKIIIQENLPKTGVGKIAKQEIRKNMHKFV